MHFSHRGKERSSDGKFSALSTYNGDWYIDSNDNEMGHIKHFNIADLPSWCFGANDDSINSNDFTSASVLLYKKSKEKLQFSDHEQCNCYDFPIYLERKIKSNITFLGIYLSIS